MNLNHELFLFSNLSHEDDKPALCPLNKIGGAMSRTSRLKGFEIPYKQALLQNQYALPISTKFNDLLQGVFFENKETAIKYSEKWMFSFYKNYPDTPFEIILSTSFTKSCLTWVEEVERDIKGNLIIPSMEKYNQKIREKVSFDSDIKIKHIYTPLDRHNQKAIIRCFVEFPGVVFKDNPHSMINEKLQFAIPNAVFVSEIKRTNLIEVGNLPLATELNFKKIVTRKDIKDNLPKQKI